jgi:hypothetical protein
VIHGQYEVEEVEEVRQLPGPKTEPTCLGDILAEPVDSADESHSGKGSFGETEL